MLSHFFNSTGFLQEEYEEWWINALFSFTSYFLFKNLKSLTTMKATLSTQIYHHIKKGIINSTKFGAGCTFSPSCIMWHLQLASNSFQAWLAPFQRKVYVICRKKESPYANTYLNSQLYYNSPKIDQREKNTLVLTFRTNYSWMWF